MFAIFFITLQFESNIESGPTFTSRDTVEIRFNVYRAANVTATAQIFGFHFQNITSPFLRKLYNTTRAKDQPMKYIIAQEYLNDEIE